MNGDDRGPRAQIRIPDEGVELATGLYQAFVDLAQPLGLSGVVARPIFCAQTRVLSISRVDLWPKCQVSVHPFGTRAQAIGPEIGQIALALGGRIVP